MGEIVLTIIIILAMYWVLSNSMKRFDKTDIHSEKMFYILLGASAIYMIFKNVIDLVELLTPLTSMVQ